MWAESLENNSHLVSGIWCAILVTYIYVYTWLIILILTEWYVVPNDLVYIYIYIRLYWFWLNNLLCQLIWSPQNIESFHFIWDFKKWFRLLFLRRLLLKTIGSRWRNFDWIYAQKSAFTETIGNRWGYSIGFMEFNI